MASNAQKLSAAAKFISDAPPGEMLEVLADIRAIVEKDSNDEFEPALEKYNTEQLITFKTTESDRQVIVSDFNKLENGSFVDYESCKTFRYDHVTNRPSGWESYPVDEEVSSIILSITKPLEAYVLEHYPSQPAFAVCPPSPTATDQEIYTILIVGNKYNNSNYWNGRWRSVYKYNPKSSTLQGTVTIVVHYFEDGNVLVKTDHPVAQTEASSPSALVKTIAEGEKMYQEELNKAFSGLGEGIFKGLRRLLPVTKQKVEWEKVATYKVKPGQK